MVELLWLGRLRFAACKPLTALVLHHKREMHARAESIVSWQVIQLLANLARRK